MGEFFLFIILLICLFYLIQILNGKLKLKSKSHDNCSPHGVGDSSLSDCSGGGDGASG